MLTAFAEQLALVRDRGLLDDVLAVLPPRRRRVIEHVLANPDRPMTLVGRELGLSYHAMRRHQEYATTVMRRRLSENSESWFHTRAREQRRKRRVQRDLFVADVSNALRQCFPERADELLRELERRLL